MAGTSHLTTAEEAEIRGEFADLYATFQGLNDEPTLTLRRRSTTTGAFTTVATFRPYGLRLLNRAEQESGANAGAVTSTVAGQMRVDGDLTILQDDRFNWNGEPCEVQMVSPDTNLAGLRRVEFAVIGAG